MDQAAALCVESREWRQTEKPWTTDPATVRPLFDKGTLTFTPKLDCKNRPVMVIDPTHTTSGDSERVVRCFQWTLEATIAQLHKGPPPELWHAAPPRRIAPRASAPRGVDRVILRAEVPSSCGSRPTRDGEEKPRAQRA